MAVPMRLWFAERQLYWIAPGTDMAANRAWIFAHPLHTLMMLFVNIVFLVFVVVWREWLAWLLPPLAVILVTRWRADKRAVATACTAAFL